MKQELKLQMHKILISKQIRNKFKIFKLMEQILN